MATITPDDIVFAGPGETLRAGLACPVCGSRDPSRLVASVPGLVEPHVPLTLLRCASCASLYYDPPGIRDFSDLDQKRDDFWRFYVEAGGGVWETIWPILVARPRGSLLDVGCGFGFALDFWQRTGRGEAIGVELADYGGIGAEKLGVTIHGEMLERCVALAGRRFDVVYASEVIEHVPDPGAFAALVGRWVADDGVLILTTPAASFVAPSNRSTTQLAALAPGFHGFLMSTRALEEAVRAAGFAHVRSRVANERQFVWASRRPLAPIADPELQRAAYFEYMAARFALPDDASPVWMGYAYRYLRDLVNTAQFALAKRVAERLAAAIASVYGSDALDPERTVPRLAACRSLTDVGRVAPFFIPCYYQLAAVVAQHVDGDAAAARRLYCGAADAAMACTRIGVVFFLEAAGMVWSARLGDALIALAMGDASGAATLVRLADEGLECSAANAYATVAPVQIEALLPPVAEDLAARGQWAPAAVIAAAYSRHVERHYGAALATLPGIDRALRDPAVARPLDPLFAPFFAALDAVRTPERADAARGALAEVARIADTVSDGYAPRARAVAAKARAAAGMPPGEPFSFSIDYGVTRHSR
jgi:SAM-dependent methyltransferase